jgi:hypothetical protein
MHPGLITTEPIQKKIIEDLIRNKVRYIVLTDGHAENYPDDESSENSKLLDIFIESNYNEVQSFGDYTILCSKKS